ncbi:hypothetical protein JCM17960_30740 [Magnetospira thiophila]
MSQKQTVQEQAQGQAKGPRVGELLRAARLKHGDELGDVARNLRIRQFYLEAIEQNRIVDLPGMAYATGFIRSYAEYLGLDADEVVRRFRQESGPGPQSDLKLPTPITERGVPSGAILLVGLVIALIGYGAWFVSSSEDRPVVDLISPLPDRLSALLPPTEGEQPPSDVQEPTPTETPTPTVIEQTTEPETASATQEEVVEVTAEPVAPEPVQEPEAAKVAQPTPEPAPAQVPVAEIQPAPATVAAEESEPTPPEAQSDIPSAPEATQQAAQPVIGGEQEAARIQVKARVDSWIQVRENTTNRLVVTRLLRAGDTFHVPDEPGLRLVTGNAGGLEISVDGEVVPDIGPMGAVLRNVAMDPERLKDGTAVVQKKPEDNSPTVN